MIIVCLDASVSQPNRATRVASPNIRPFPASFPHHLCHTFFQQPHCMCVCACVCESVLAVYLTCLLVGLRQPVHRQAEKGLMGRQTEQNGQQNMYLFIRHFVPKGVGQWVVGGWGQDG